TYPMATTGLEWVRRHRGLSIPTATWVAAFDPHPSWVHRDVGMNFVMHDVGVSEALRGVPEAVARVSPLPVSGAFRAGGRAMARHRWELPDAAFIALGSGGWLGFGDVVAPARDVLRGRGSGSRVGVLTGRNDA